MFFIRKIALVVLGAALGCNTVFFASSNEVATESKMMYDFRTLSSLDKWQESSDVVRRPGMSKGAFVLQKTQLFQRAVMFSMLNPQPNGAGFVSFFTYDNWNLLKNSGLELRLRGQGQNFHYKVMLKHNGDLIDDGSVSYQRFFKVTPDEWMDVVVPFSEFKGYFRGHEVPDAAPLDTKNITLVGLQIVGGVYSDFKQQGSSSLEIDYIKAV